MFGSQRLLTVWKVSASNSARSKQEKTVLSGCLGVPGGECAEHNGQSKDVGERAGGVEEQVELGAGEQAQPHTHPRPNPDTVHSLC